MKIIKNLFGKKSKTDDELKAEIFKKASDHLHVASDSVSTDNDNIKKDMPIYGSTDKDKNKNVRAVLLEIASHGDVGVLAISVSDNVSMNQRKASTALSFLTENSYVESVNSPAGKKYFLTAVGRKFCISKEFNSDF